MNANRRGKAGLVLSGGGARAAYQVGVLKAVRELLRDPRENPFPIVCGTSAGAINAATIAVYADDFGRAIDNLALVWENFRPEQVYRTDPWALARIGVRWLATLSTMFRNNPVSLLDPSPLYTLLAKRLDLTRIQDNIDSAALYAVAITASGYTSGQSVSFYQGGPGLMDWRRTKRIGAATSISHDILMASTALPFIFPAVRVHREFFGDGSMRQLAPVSPALHLGADRVFVIGTGRHEVGPLRVRASLYPSLAQIAGHALDSIFLDGLAVDLERLHRINRTISLIPPDKRAAAGMELHHVHVFEIQPSRPIERIAAGHARNLPWTMRYLLRAVGGMNRNGSNLASYLLFVSSYCRALIDLGYGDTMARRGEVLAFLYPPN